MAFKKGQTPWNKGKAGIYSEESRKKMSNSQKRRMLNPIEREKFLKIRITTGHKGKKHSEESRKRMSKALKGSIPWIKGKNHSPETLLKMGLTHKGQIAWNKGLTKIDERVKKYSLKLKGKQRSEETRKHISESHKGKPTWNKGKKGIYSDETKRKMGLTNIGHVPWNKGKEHPSAKNLPQAFKKGQVSWNKGLIGYQAGEKSPLWKGGISFEPYSLEWTKVLKKIIKERDNYTCQLCYKKGIIIHHVDYNKKNCNPKNLITLCGSCHSKTNVHREKWKKFFEEVLNKKSTNL